MVIRLGLAAFAVSAYIKTVLCPSLSSYTPRMSSASLVRAPAGPLLSLPQNTGSNHRFPTSAAASSLPCKHHPAVDAMALVDRDLGSTHERHIKAAGLQSQRFQQGVRVLSGPPFSSGNDALFHTHVELLLINKIASHIRPMLMRAGG